MNLYQKYRPFVIDQIRGNKDVVEYLTSALSEENIESFPHTLLLEGPTGCGKTTIARIIAKSLGCVGMDLSELNVANLRGIDTIREIINQARYKPMEGKVRIWLIDECHMMTKDAQNAFLKILEDTPEHVYFILCTTDPHKLIKTILGRCIRLKVSPLEDKAMTRLLNGIAKQEGTRVDRDVIAQIVQDSLGLPRNAIQTLDQVLKVSPEQQLAAAKKAAAEISESIALCQALLKGGNWKKVQEILKGIKEQDPESIRRHVLGYAQAVLLNGGSPESAHIIEEFWEPLYDIGFPGLVYCCYAVVKG